MNHGRLSWLFACVLVLLLQAACRGPEASTPALTPTDPATEPATPAQPLPDLMPVSSFFRVRYDACPWGGPGEIALRIRNAGAGPAAPFVVEINGITTEAAALPPGSEAEATVGFEEGPVGSINATIDPANMVPESDEGNNVFQILFTPPPPCATATP